MLVRKFFVRMCLVGMVFGFGACVWCFGLCLSACPLNHFLRMFWESSPRIFSCTFSCTCSTLLSLASVVPKKRSIHITACRDEGIKKKIQNRSVKMKGIRFHCISSPETVKGSKETRKKISEQERFHPYLDMYIYVHMPQWVSRAKMLTC